MTKKELRLNYTLKRALLTEEEKTFYAKRIISDFFDFLHFLDFPDFLLGFVRGFVIGK